MSPRSPIYICARISDFFAWNSTSLSTPAARSSSSFLSRSSGSAAAAAPASAGTGGGAAGGGACRRGAADPREAVGDVGEELAELRAPVVVVDRRVRPAGLVD